MTTYPLPPAMRSHRVVCARQEPLAIPHEDPHIVLIGTGPDARRYQRTWTIPEVYAALQKGDLFYTESPSTGARASVGRWECRQCQRSTLRASPGAEKDGRLENLPRC